MQMRVRLMMMRWVLLVQLMLPLVMQGKLHLLLFRTLLGMFGR